MNFKNIEIKRYKNETQTEYLARKEKHIKRLISEEKKARRGKKLLQTTIDLKSIDKKIREKEKRRKIIKGAVNVDLANVEVVNVELANVELANVENNYNKKIIKIFYYF